MTVFKLLSGCVLCLKFGIFLVKTRASRWQLKFVDVLHFCPHVAGQRQLLYDRHSFHCDNYFVIAGIRTCLGVSSDTMVPWISENSCPRPLDFLLVRSHQAEKIIVNRLIQERNETTVRVEPRLGSSLKRLFCAQNTNK